jgi:hypothetical protein
MLVPLGILAGSGPAIGDQTASNTFGYTCQFPSGAQPISVVVNATFPEVGTVDTPITPTDVSAELDLPPAALADLTTLNATSVTATGTLSVLAEQNGASSTVTWPGLTSPSTTIPGTGDLTVTISGAVSPITEAQPGDVTIGVGAFGLILTPLASDGSATNPATVPVACELDSGQPATLATVPIPAPNPATTPVTTSTAPAAGGANTATPNRSAATPGAKATASASSPCTPPVNPPPKLIAYLAGRTNLPKLDESSVLGPGTITLTNQGIGIITGGFAICYSGVMVLQPSTTTILGFGFMPITATLTYTQLPGQSMSIVATQVGAVTGVTATGMETVGITRASINGVPLDVGVIEADGLSSCRATVRVTLANIPNPPTSPPNAPPVYPYNAAIGGYLQGTVPVPSFTGCGPNGDGTLNAMLSAPISTPVTNPPDPGSLTRMCQGKPVPIPPPPAPPPVPPPPSEAANHCIAP